MLGSRLSLNRLAEWIERRSWLVQLWLWALSCMRHRPTKYPKKRLLGKVIVSVDVAVGSLATGRGKLEVQPCPQCPVSDGRPEKGGLSLWAQQQTHAAQQIKFHHSI